MHTEIIFQEDRAVVCSHPQQQQLLVASLPRTGSSPLVSIGDTEILVII